MAISADRRGWGRGWPVNRIGDMVWVRAPRSGTRFQVHRDIAIILTHALKIIEDRGYLLHYPGQVHDDWSYVNRPIAGTRTPSNHSWGLAIDIDATKYPQGQRRRVPPAWLVDVMRAHGFEWGGTWSRADPMHFEYAGTRAEAQRVSRALWGAPPAPKPPAPGVDWAALARAVTDAKKHIYRLGDRHPNVKFIQERINQLSGRGLKVDGDFGPMTHRAVVDLQQWVGLHADGIVGPATWRVLYP